MAAPPRTAEYTKLSGVEKTAILLVAIGDTYSTKLLSMMHEEEVLEVSKAMIQLGPVKAEIVEQLAHEFMLNVGGISGLAGGYDTTQRLLATFLPPDRVAALMEDIQGPTGRTTWEKLGNVKESVLAAYLKNEYPQTVAVVISKIKPAQAAAVLNELPETFASEVIMRMLRMESVQKDVLDGVERTLRSEFMSNLARTTRRDPYEHLATIFNSFDRKAEARFFGQLEERDKDAAGRIRTLMFTFDDLIKIVSPGIQLLVRSVQKDRIALALKGASKEMRDLFFENLSERAGKMLKDEIDALGAVKLRDVDDSRAEIVRVAKELAAGGKIEISQGAEEEVVY
jgi:flagellar motor switch protein FliG